MSIDLLTSTILQKYSIFGEALTSTMDMSGDIDGDGINDVVIGISSASPLGRPSAGAVYVLLGRAKGQENIDLTNVGPGFRMLGAHTNDYTGNSVSTGDVNNDGFSDVIIGANRASPLSRSDAGITYVIFGKSGGFADIDLASLSSAAGYAIYGPAGTQSGTAVLACDINNDGFADVITSGRAVGTTAVSTFAVFGKANGFANVDLASLSTSDGVRFTGNLNNYAVTSIGCGDVNWDNIDDLILGSPAANPLSRTNAGLTTVVYGNSTISSTVNLLNVYNNSQGFSIYGATGSKSGSAVAVADLNQDGYSDVIVGAPNASPLGRSGAGAAYVLNGSQNSTNVDLASTFTGFTIAGSAANTYYGVYTNSGDINGDGYPDAVISFPYATFSGRAFAGTINVIYGKSGISPDIDLASLSLTDGFNMFAGAYYQVACLSTGDVNGDGNDDLALSNIYGAITYQDSVMSPLTNFTFNPVTYGAGTNPTLPLVPNIDLATAPSSEAFHFLGGITSQVYTISNAVGDINGDGFKDIVVGGPLASPFGRTNAGMVTVVLGNSVMTNVNLTALTNTKGFTISGAVAGDNCGISVAVKDLNNDGYDDIVIGAPRASPLGRSLAGMVYTIYGKSGGFTDVDLANLPSTGGFVINGTTSNDRLGISVIAGDINNDNHPEIIISSNVFASAGAQATTYVLYGSSSGFNSMDLTNFSPTIGMQILGTTYGAKMAIGDVNGDGINDIVTGTGTPSPALDRTNAGVTTIIYGHTVMPSSINLDFLNQNLGYAIYGAFSQDRTGLYVAVGDINNDGIEDIIMGAPYASPFARTSAGATYVVFGKANSTDIDLLHMSNYRGFVVYGSIASGYNGDGVAVGYINNDTYADLVIGTPFASPSSRTSAGEATVIFGKLNGFSNIDLASLSPNDGFFVFGANANDEIASAIAVGDIDNDGYPDIVLSSAQSTTYVVKGSVVQQTLANSYSNAPTRSHSHSPETNTPALNSHSQSHNTHSQSHHSPTPQGDGPPSSSTSHSDLSLIIGASVGGACALAILAAAFYYKNKHAAAAGGSMYAMKDIKGTDAAPTNDKQPVIIQEEFSELNNGTWAYSDADALYA